ncbi:hypothetical protein BH09PLA1_BH09PLA1_27870 [soil metagenome]
MTKPGEVSAAFMKSMKSKDMGKASKYWIPESADTWRTEADAKIESMQSGSYKRFFEDLPDGSTPFTVAPADPKAPANEQTMICNGTTLTLRQVDNKWYVCKAPL